MDINTVRTKISKHVLAEHSIPSLYEKMNRKTSLSSMILLNQNPICFVHQHLQLVKHLRYKVQNVSQPIRTQFPNLYDRIQCKMYKTRILVDHKPKLSKAFVQMFIIWFRRFQVISDDDFEWEKQTQFQLYDKFTVLLKNAVIKDLNNLIDDHLLSQWIQWKNIPKKEEDQVSAISQILQDKGQIDEYSRTRLFLTGLPAKIRERVIRAQAIDPKDSDTMKFRPAFEKTMTLSLLSLSSLYDRCQRTSR